MNRFRTRDSFVVKPIHCINNRLSGFTAELFDNYMQQDAHEFLNYLLNTIADLLQEEKKQDKQNGKLANGTLDSQKSNSTPPSNTWVHEIFQGTLTNETRCLTCETVMHL